VYVKEQNQVKISNRFAALKNVDDDNDVDINNAWEVIRKNVKATTTDSPRCYELNQHRSRFDEECSKLLDNRKQTELQC
jgi:nicotinamide riboside kinase